jgi:hypothetical protein
MARERKAKAQLHRKENAINAHAPVSAPIQANFCDGPRGSSRRRPSGPDNDGESLTEETSRHAAQDDGMRSTRRSAFEACAFLALRSALCAGCLSAAARAAPANLCFARANSKANGGTAGPKRAEHATRQLPWRLSLRQPCCVNCGAGPATGGKIGAMARLHEPRASQDGKDRN